MEEVGETPLSEILEKKLNSLGYWWPMSAEAEDAICVIETGYQQENDAGHRWQGNIERGPMIRDV